MSEPTDTDESGTESDGESELSYNQENTHAMKHGLYADRDIFYESLERSEQQLVMDIVTDLLDQYDGDVGAYEREAIRNIAIDTVKRRRYNEHIFALDKQIGDEKSQRASQTYSRLVRDLTNELKELGLLEQNPEARKADAAQSWMAQITQAKNATKSEDGAN
jgi:hypothetical protein